MSQFQIYKSFINILILSFLFLMVNSQLTIQDKETIEKFILQNQSKSTGLFFESSEPYKHTKEVISIFKDLGLQIKHKKEICKKISEIKEVDINIVSIDKLLECKTDFQNYKPNFTKTKLLELYYEAQIMDILNINNINNWKDLYKKLKHFLVEEKGKFSLFKIKESKKKQLLLLQ